MSSETFKNSPVVEVIAEVQWGYTSAHQGVVMPVMPHEIANYDPYFNAFTKEISQHGYGNVERVVPIGFPIMPHEPTLRIRSGADASTLFQLSSHLFTANAVQPYSSWDDFSPTIQLGLEAAFKARKSMSTSDDVVNLSLRYLDAFRVDLTEGKPMMEFLANSLGINLNINDAIAKHCSIGKSITPAIRLSVPVDIGILSMSFSEGELQGELQREKAVFMEMHLAIIDSVNANETEVMSKFAEARGLIHTIFVEMTKNIAHLMQKL